MASEERAESSALALFEALAEQPFAFDFFQALRRLECAFPQRPRLGKSSRSGDDPIRLTQKPSVAFAPSTLAAMEPHPQGLPPRLSVYFLGLFGANGPLPLHLTEYARERLEHHNDPTLIRFADVFHHRLLALFYRAWADAQPVVQFDRPQQDRFSHYLGASFGLGMPSLRHRDAAPDLAKLFYAGLFTAQTGHADGLAALLADFFGVSVQIQQFVGHWIELSPDNMTRLGESAATGTLGHTAVIGERVWDCQHKFRIVIGPIGYVDYQRLLPGGESLPRLVALVRQYIGDSLSWDVQLILKKAEVPALQLGVDGRLGWTTWATTGPMAEDADDLALDARVYG